MKKEEQTLLDYINQFHFKKSKSVYIDLKIISITSNNFTIVIYKENGYKKTLTINIEETQQKIMKIKRDRKIDSIINI